MAFNVAFEVEEVTTFIPIRTRVNKDLTCPCGSTSFKVIPSVHETEDGELVHLHFKCHECPAEWCSGYGEVEKSIS